MVREKSTRQRLNTFSGSGLPITIEQPRNCGVEQQAVIAIIATALHEALPAEVNYDHVNLTIPKAQLPLNYRKHRYDVACLVRDRVILIDVLSVDTRYWDKAGEAGHAEG